MKKGCGVCAANCDRPRWAEKLRFAVDKFPPLGWPNWTFEAWDKLVQQPLLRLLCLRYNHGQEWEGRCVYCGSPQP